MLVKERGKYLFSRLKRQSFALLPDPVRLKLLPLILELEEVELRAEVLKFAFTCVRGSLKYGNDAAVDRFGLYESAMTDKLVEIINKDTIFLDVGAGAGIYSVLAAKILSPQNVHAFEPDRLSGVFFRLNNEKYYKGNIRLIKRYVGDKVTRNMITLDEYCSLYNVRPTLIKMDIEGWEYYALRGMERIFWDYSPILLIEFHERILRERFAIGSDRAKDVIRRIESAGYKVLYNGHHYYANTHGGVPEKEWYDRPPNDVNYALFCCPI